MLIQLKATNFRRHRSLTLTYTDGINTIRAANEAGKSTTYEALGYCLFGVKALRTTLEEAVTWGEDVKTLKVELTLQVDGKTYHFSRGKSGAEVKLGGEVFITGQSEVSAFAAKLVGAEVAVANKLMFANQGNLRGALEEGPKALSTLIEDLAGFDTFDRLLESAQQNLTLGSSAVAEERLKSAREHLDGLKSMPVPPVPDEAETQARIAEIQKLIDESQAARKVLEPTMEAAYSNYEKINKAYEEKRDADEAVAKAKAEVAAAEAKLAALVPPPPVAADIPTLEAELARAKNHQAVLTTYRTFKSLPEFNHLPAAEVEALRAKVAQGQGSGLVRQVETLERELIKVRARRINHDKCDKCGQDVTHLDHVKQTNAEVDARVAELEAELAEARVKWEEVAALSDKLQAHLHYVATCDRQTLPLRNTDLVQFDETLSPAGVTWVGAVPEGTVDVAAIESRLQAARAQVQSHQVFAGKQEALREAVEAAQRVLKEANQHWSSLPRGRKEDALAAFDVYYKMQQKFDDMVEQEETRAIEIKVLQGQSESARQLYQQYQQQVALAEKQVADFEQDIKTLEFNNALVKKLRTIRPLVADQIWNTLLNSVSVMFSQMRGDESIVSKDKSGFRVNGQPVEALSGSTLDLLGLALRCALLRTFLPSCGLLVLDEPGAAMDTARVESMLGFLASTGFAQTLLVTHDNIAEMVSDNLITF